MPGSRPNAATAAAGGTTDPTPLVNGSSVDLTHNLTDANLSGSGGTVGALLGLYDSTTGNGKIAVTATDTECKVSATEAVSGPVTFTVSNKGAKVTEFYVFAAGDRIMGEVENIDRITIYWPGKDVGKTVLERADLAKLGIDKEHTIKQGEK